MPLYDYKCKNGHTFEAFKKVKDRLSARCPVCNLRGAIQITRAPAGHVFKGGWYEHLDVNPVYINTPQELRDACDKRGLRSLYLEDSPHKTRGTVQDTQEAIDAHNEEKQHRAAREAS